MLQRQSHAPASVYAAADHLDGILAAWEDLLALGGRISDGDWYRGSVRRFELKAILHVLHAREHVEELRADARMARIAALFLAGTIAFAETSRAGRALPADPAPDSAAIDGAFRIANCVPIRELTRLAGAFLDALEIHYVLYGSENPPAARSASVDPHRTAPQM